MRDVQKKVSVEWINENFCLRGGDVYWRVQTAANVRNLDRPAGYVNQLGYRLIAFSLLGEKTSVYAHRVAFVLAHGRWPEGHIDHLDGVRDNNAPENLRDVWYAENNQNKRMSRNNTSGYVGVHPVGRRWRATLGKTGRLGIFDSLEEAVSARAAASAAAGYHPNHGRA